MLLPINTSSSSYSIIFTKNIINPIEIYLNANTGLESISIFTDYNLESDCVDLSKKINKVFKNVRIFSIKSGEKSKNINTVMDLAHKLLSNQCSRNSLFIGLGGGVIGDLTGFLSAIYMRGVPLINIPTSLLAMVDSSIGGKNGIDTIEGKNLLGTFKQPENVIINQDFLHSLPRNELINGMAEVIKYGLINDGDFFKYIENNNEKIFNLDEDVIHYVIYKSCLTKKEFVEADTNEKSIRKILNFGHSIGHAIEKLSNYKISHGNAISIGMIFDLWFSSNYFEQEVSHIEKVKRIFKKFGLMTDIPKKFKTRDIINNIKFDKKGNGEHIDYILLEEIGSPKIVNIRIDYELEQALNDYIYSQNGDIF